MTSETTRTYTMRISRMTVDKLGVKLYDKVSAVVAELVANSYDADAQNVEVTLPLGTSLYAAASSGDPVIEVKDDGHGMMPDEAQKFFLVVGQDRRQRSGGARSPQYDRPVMGRKGIGKLAPFGVCHRIEVVSAGGEETENGYMISHFIMDYENVVVDSSEPVPLETGKLDGSFQPKSGTIVRLSSFLRKKVPDKDTFERQLGRRFLPTADFQILVIDSIGQDHFTLEPTSPEIDEGTYIDLNERPVLYGDEQLPVSGWIAMGKTAYKNEEMAGVRIYARKKIVATTRDFEQHAGFTGEFTVRSYLVGEVEADWLDEDEDLVRSDRQGILWESEYGVALREWGAKLVREVGNKGKEPKRAKRSELFLVNSDFQQRVSDAFPGSPEIRSTAIGLAEQIGGFAHDDELEDVGYLTDLCEVIISVAPHKALIEAFQEFRRRAAMEEVSLTDLNALFGSGRIAEMASYAQIASERVRTIEELESLVQQQRVAESELQALIERANWLVDPVWSVISQNQSLSTFCGAFGRFWSQRTGEDLDFTMSNRTKRPDFMFVHIGHMLHLVEIKARGHAFEAKDLGRLQNYVDSLEEFFKQNVGLRNEFGGWLIDLIADGEKLSGVNKTAMESHKKEQRVVRKSWDDFLMNAKNVHNQFLEAARQANV